MLPSYPYGPVLQRIFKEVGGGDDILSISGAGEGGERGEKGTRGNNHIGLGVSSSSFTLSSSFSSALSLALSAEAAGVQVECVLFALQRIRMDRSDATVLHFLQGLMAPERFARLRRPVRFFDSCMI